MDPRSRSLSLRLTQRYRLWRGDAADPRGGRAAWFDVRLAVMVWLILAAAVSLRTFVRPNHHTVFPIFAASAEHWWGNCSLYDLYLGLDRFRYPPVFALFVTPFSALGLTAGGIVWSWVSIAILLVGLWQYVRDVIPSAWTRQRTAVFLMLGAFGALRGLWNAQSNALITGFVLLGVAALARAASGEWRVASGEWREKRRLLFSPLTTRHSPLDARHSDWWLAALFFATAVCLKLTPLAPLLMLVVLWPRQLAWRLLVVMAGLFLLPFLTRPPDLVFEHYREWIEHLMESGNIRWIGFRDGWTIWIVIQHLLGCDGGALPLGEPMDSFAYRFVQLATAAAALVWCLRQKYRAGRCGLGSRWLVHVALSMGLAWLMLFGPAVEHSTYVFLAPPLLWAVLERRAWPLGQGLIWASFALIMVLGWGAVTRLLSPDWPVLLTTLPAGTALFALWLIGYARNCVNECPPASTAASRLPSYWRLLPGSGRRDEKAIPS